MDSYVVAFVIAGLVICLCAPLFGSLAQGIMGAMDDVSPRTGRIVSSVFRARHLRLWNILYPCRPKCLALGNEADTCIWLEGARGVHWHTAGGVEAAALDADKDGTLESRRMAAPNRAA